MNHEDQADGDAFTRWLVAYDEHLRNGESRGLETEPIDFEANEQAQMAKRCVELLRRASGYRAAAHPVAPNGSSDAPSHPEQLGRFWIEREIGRGGLGIVYLGYDPDLRRQVAIKIPRADAVSDPDIQRRFEREGEAAGKLSHPNLLPVYEVGRHEGRSFLVSEFCAGPNLAQWMAARAEPVTPTEAAGLVVSLAEAVQHAHSCGVLHRDLKPSNIMLDLDIASQSALQIVPRLTDFGTAKLLDGQSNDTRTGAIIGTPAYMAPEQADSRLSRVDVRTDVYALGAILYELLTGRPPFVGASDIDTLRQLITDDPNSPRRVNPNTPRDLEAICLKCLARSPSQRYPTAQSLTDDLRRFLQGQPTEARPLGWCGHAARWSRRRPLAATMVAASLAFLTVLLSIALAYDLRLRREVVRANAAQDRAEALLYSSDVRLAFEALEANDVARALDFLERQVPQPGAADSREFAWHLLRRRCQPELMTLRGHTGAIHGVAYSPDGRSIVTASADHTARIWDAATGQPTHVLRGHLDELTCAAYSLSGGEIATGGDDCVVRTWDAATGRPLRELRGHNSAVMELSYARNGTWLASSALDGEVRIWDAKTGELLQALHDTTDVVQALAFLDDCGVLLAGDEGGAIHSWRTSDWERTSQVTLEREKIFALAPAPAGNGFAAAGRRELIHLGSLRRNRVQVVGQLGGGHREWIQALAYSPRGDVLASGGKDAVVQLWDLGSGAVTRTFLGHSARVWSVAWSPDGERIVSGSQDSIAKVWPATVGESWSAASEKDGLNSLAFAEKTRQLLTVDSGGQICAWDADSGQLAWERTVTPNQEIVSLELSRDESLAAIRVKSGATRVLQTKTGELLHFVDCISELGFPLTWLGDTHCLATTVDAKTVALFDANAGKIIARVPLSHPVRHMVCMADGRTLVISTEQGLHFWNAAEQRMSRSIPLSSAWECAVSPDDHRVWVSRGSNVQGVDLERGDVASTLVTIGADAREIAVSPDNRTLAVGLHSPEHVSLWDIRTGQELMRLKTDAVVLKKIRFSSDGRRLAAVAEGPQSQSRLWQWSIDAQH